MAEIEHPQIYLITPSEIELSRFPDTLARVLDTADVACLRLALSSRDEDHILRTADALRQQTHDRDIAIVIETHLLLVERLGLDGVHLTDGARSVRAAREALGEDAIVGTFAHTSRHDGMTAGEAGADYVSFGPLDAGALGDGQVADPDLFTWWSEMIEVPIVAEGGLTEEHIRALSPHTDFFGIGEELWRSDDPAQTLDTFVKAMK
ncbi:UNVERIFIED_CONTAM: hypothetical protein GTU68_055585 [Idotea baltica]|nr:hypothetical protein [Idotea baltica]